MQSWHKHSLTPVQVLPGTKSKKGVSCTSLKLLKHHTAEVAPDSEVKHANDTGKSGALSLCLVDTVRILSNSEGLKQISPHVPGMPVSLAIGIFLLRLDMARFFSFLGPCFTSQGMSLWLLSQSGEIPSTTDGSCHSLLQAAAGLGRFDQTFK